MTGFDSLDPTWLEARLFLDFSCNKFLPWVSVACNQKGLCSPNTSSQLAHFATRQSLEIDDGTMWLARCIWQHLEPYLVLGTASMAHRGRGIQGLPPFWAWASTKGPQDGVSCLGGASAFPLPKILPSLCCSGRFLSLPCGSLKCLLL